MILFLELIFIINVECKNEIVIWDKCRCLTIFFLEEDLWRFMGRVYVIKDEVIKRRFLVKNKRIGVGFVV